MAEDIDMYSDASGVELKGFGAYCGTSWTFHAWEPDFIRNKNLASNT